MEHVDEGNYSLLSGWPIIFLKCERDDSARALLSMMAEKFKQTEKRGLNQVHVNRRVIRRTQARTVHWSTSLNIRHRLWKVCEGSVTLTLILTTETAQSTPMWIHLKTSLSLCFGLSHIMRMFFFHPRKYSFWKEFNRVSTFKHCTLTLWYKQKPFWKHFIGTADSKVKLHSVGVLLQIRMRWWNKDQHVHFERWSRV